MQEKTDLDLKCSPEGSLDRKWARRVLMTSARIAHKEGKSYYKWLEDEDQGILDTVSQKDVESIYAMIWFPEKR